MPPPTDTNQKNKNNQPESSIFYDLPQQMGRCCAGLSEQNKANSEKIAQTNNKLDALNRNESYFKAA